MNNKATNTLPDLNARLDQIRNHVANQPKRSAANIMLVGSIENQATTFLAMRELLRGAIPDDELSDMAARLVTDPNLFGNQLEDVANALTDIAEAIREASEKE